MISVAPAPDADTVRGERSVSMVEGARGIQSRASSLLAAGLMAALGVMALAWYYAHALTHPARARQAAQSSTAARAQAEMALPPLGRIDPPAPQAVPAPQDGAHAAPAAPDLPLTEAAGSAPNASAAPPPPLGARPPQERALRRRLSGPVFAREPTSASAPAGSAAAPDAPQRPSGPGADAPRSAERDAGALGALLRPSVIAAAQARRLPGAHWLLPRGAFIDCTLETAIDSTLPGMTTCVTAADTFGADGKVVLLERGTKLVGETRGQVEQGQARLFVLWTEARTPQGVVVPLDSPGTDELGRSGLPGHVERHFWERFGAALLVSVINGAVQAGVQASARPGGAVIYAPSGAQDVLAEVLRDTLRIAPTITKRNGERVQVLVARDVDFGPVYELRAAGGR